jgi:phytanoyl-CoA hydroxylase
MPALTPRQSERFREDGFLIYGPLLGSDEVSAAGERIDALASAEGEDARVRVRMEADADSLDGVSRRDKTWQLMMVAEADEVIAGIAKHPKILDVVRQLMATDQVSYLQDQVLMKPAHHGSHVSWHQDSGYWTGIEPWIDPPAIVTCWVAIDNVTEENGCVQMVPGSHKRGVLPHEPGGDHLLHVQGVDLSTAVPVVLPPGGVSFHHSCTVHGSAPNTTPHRRRGLALTYVRDDARRLGRRATS